MKEARMEGFRETLLYNFHFTYIIKVTLWWGLSKDILIYVYIQFTFRYSENFGKLSALHYIIFQQINTLAVVLLKLNLRSYHVAHILCWGSLCSGWNISISTSRQSSQFQMVWSIILCNICHNDRNNFFLLLNTLIIKRILRMVSADDRIILYRTKLVDNIQFN